MTSNLFVYGTLMRGYVHPMARLLSANADFLGEASCRGRLYMVKHYPGLVLSDDADDIVHGELYRLREVTAMLREFDMYEACGEGFPEPTQYLRKMLTVTLADGSVSEAWTYIYNWPVEKLTRSEARKATSSATSSGRPTRFIGIRLVMYASTSGAVPSFMGVAMTAGAMALTSTPVVASSLPADLVRPMTAALDAE